MTQHQKHLLRTFLEDLMVDDVTNHDDPSPTVWLTGNIKASDLNEIRAGVGLGPEDLGDKEND